MNPPSTHAEFVELARDHAYWSIRDSRRAFRLAWGFLGEVAFWLGHVLCVLVPLSWLGFLCWESSNYWIAAWAPFTVWTALVANRTAIELLPGIVLFIVVGAPLSLFFGVLQLKAAGMPIVAWMFAVMSKAYIADRFLKRLVKSPLAWEKVMRENLLRQG